MPVKYTYQLRRGTAAQWTQANPVLSLAEPGWETDTDKLKFGDGVTAWNGLPYFGQSAASSDILVSTAGVTISGHTVVMEANDGKIYPVANDVTARQAIGITTGGASLGNAISVQMTNILAEPSWNWSNGLPVWLGANGGLTQILPTAGALLQVGIPVGPTALKIEIDFIALLN